MRTLTVAAVAACLTVAGAPAVASDTAPDSSPAPDRTVETAGPDGIHGLFAAPLAEPADGVWTHRAARGPTWTWLYDPDRAPATTFRPAPAPDLMVAEPDHGDVRSDLVHAASAILGRPTPWTLEPDQANRLLDDAEQAARGMLAITGRDFTADGLLGAATDLGSDADNLWDVDPAALSGAAAGTVGPTLAAWGQHPDHDPASLTDAIVAAQQAAGVPTAVDTRGLAHLATATELQAAAATYTDTTGNRLQLGPADRLGPTLWLHELTATVDGQPARGHLLVRLGHDDVTVDAHLAGSWDGRANVVDAAEHLDADVTVNGGFWHGTADPDGLLVTSGQVVSDTVAGPQQLDRIRSVVTVADGTVDIAMGSSRPVLTADGHGPVAVDGLNRPQQPGERVLYGPGGPDPSGPGPVTSLPGGWTLAGPPPQPADGGWQVHWQADDHLDGLDAAVSGGPRLLHDGGPAPEGWWRYEGFAPSHTDVRHPRTAIGVNAHGATMLLVVDGRQPGWSTGLTHSQTANLFASLGVTDATMLDGGGSSQLAVDGQLVNRPCCDTALRPVATVLTFDDPSR